MKGRTGWHFRYSTHIFGGHATPLHFLKMPCEPERHGRGKVQEVAWGAYDDGKQLTLQYADQALDVRHRLGSRAAQNTYGFSSTSNVMSFTYESNTGAIIALTDVTDGPCHHTTQNGTFPIVIDAAVFECCRRT